MMLIVIDSFSLASQMPTLDEKANIARVWARHLCGVIPRGYLTECFKQAVAVKTGPFAVTAYDLKDAWVKVKADVDAEIDALRFKKWNLEDEIRQSEYWTSGFNLKYHHCNGSADHVKCRERYAKDRADFTFNEASAKSELAAIDANIERLRNGTN